MAGAPIDLTARLGRRAVHVFTEEDVGAIEAAILSERPLLLLGEPGSGKSQFACAAAEALRRRFHPKTLDARTEPHELLWIDDPVGRLAQAQIVSAYQGTQAADALDKTDLRRFVRPGPLWWGFDQNTAWERLKLCDADLATDATEPDARQGAVVLIDEIDKADPSVPNALLEALGSRSFKEPGGQTIRAECRPLVIIASNNERELPTAFQRRCAVHQLQVPFGDALINFLAARGEATYPNADEGILRAAAKQTAKDRDDTEQAQLKPLPGPAEYFDLLNALFSDLRDPDIPAEDALDKLAPYFLRKKLGPQR